MYIKYIKIQKCHTKTAIFNPGCETDSSDVWRVSRCVMSSADDVKDVAALETVNSVTLTQDSDGCIILHCPPNGR